MRRAWTDRTRRLIFNLILPVLFFAIFLLLDLLSKAHFASVKTSKGIKGVFSFYYIMNKGAAFSFLADKPWGQTFFKIITPIALILFGIMFFLAFRKNYKFYLYGVTFMITGTLGNFIDRLIFSGVRDFIRLEFMNFAIFNVADILLCVGVAMVIVHFLFIDENAVFKRNVKKSEDTNE